MRPKQGKRQVKNTVLNKMNWTYFQIM